MFMFLLLLSTQYCTPVNLYTLQYTATTWWIFSLTVYSLQGWILSPTSCTGESYLLLPARVNPICYTPYTDESIYSYHMVNIFSYTPCTGDSVLHYFLYKGESTSTVFCCSLHGWIYSASPYTGESILLLFTVDNLLCYFPVPSPRH